MIESSCGRYNNELYEISDEPEVSTMIWLQRLHWAGNLQRVDQVKSSEKAIIDRKTPVVDDIHGKLQSGGGYMQQDVVTRPKQLEENLTEN